MMGAHYLACPLDLLSTTHTVRLSVKDSYALVCPFVLLWLTPIVSHKPLSSGDGMAHYAVEPELGSRTPTLRCGPLTCGEGLSCFNVTP